MTYPRKNGKSENIVFDKSKGFSFVMDDMTEEEYFDYVKNHSMMMMVLSGEMRCKVPTAPTAERG